MGQTLLGQSGRPGGRARGGRGARGRPRRTPSGPWPLGTAGPAPFQIRLLLPCLPRPPALSLVTVTATATKPPHLLASRPTNSLGGPWPSLNHTALQERCELRPQRCGRAVPGAHEEAATSRVFIVNRICLHLALPPGQSRVTGGGGLPGGAPSPACGSAHPVQALTAQGTDHEGGQEIMSSPRRPAGHGAGQGGGPAARTKAC